MLAVIIGTIVVSLFLYFYVQMIFLWLIIFILFLVNRYSDMWIYGIQIIHPLLFISTYAFGPMFAFVLCALVLGIVAKFKPYRLNGAIITAVSYTLAIILTSYMAGIYGTSITNSQFVTYGMLILVSTNYLFTIPLQMRLTPSHWSSFSNRVLWFMTDYTILNMFGLELLRTFLGT